MNLSRYIAVICVLAATPAFAQGPYVSVAAGANVPRLSHADGGTLSQPGQNETVGAWMLRTGMPLGGRWGVELEFARGLRSEWESSFDLNRPQSAIPGVYSVSFDFGPVTSPIVFPPITYRTRHRQSSISPAVWLQTDATRRVSFAVLGGVAFNYSTTETSFDAGPAQSFLLGTIVPASSREVIYGVSALAGVEARIALTEHAQLIPGVRLQGVGGGWLVRPAVGLGWQF